MKTRKYMEYQGKRIYDETEYTFGVEIFCDHCDKAIRDDGGCTVRINLSSKAFTFSLGEEDEETVMIHPDCIFMFLRDKIMEAAGRKPRDIGVFT